MDVKLPVSAHGRPPSELSPFRGPGEACVERSPRQSAFLPVALLRRICLSFADNAKHHRLGHLFHWLGNLRMASGNSFSNCRSGKRIKRKLESWVSRLIPPIFQTTRQVPDKPKESARVGIRRSSDRATVVRRRLRKPIEEKTMPVAAIERKTKITPWFPRPRSGKVRIYIESTQSVDVFVSNPPKTALITSVPVAQQHGILVYPGIQFLDQNIELPEFWATTGWNLTIGYFPGNPSARDAAVYYAVFNL
jgi:hypothetical protein